MLELFNNIFLFSTFSPMVSFLRCFSLRSLIFMGAVERHRYQTELILLISIACKPATAIAREHLVSIA